MEEKVSKEPTIEELKAIIEEKETSLNYWMGKSLEVQKKYENLKQIIKSLIVVID